MENEKISYAIPHLHLNIKSLAPTVNHKYRSLHFHNDIEIVKVVKGKLLCTVQDDEFVLNEGECLFINSRIIHKLSYYQENSICTYIQIDISEYMKNILTFSYIPAFLNNTNQKKYKIYEEKSEIFTLFDNIEYETINQNISFEEYIKAYIYQLIAFMYRNNFIINEFKQLQKKEFDKIIQAIKYINSNYKNDISLAQISKELNISMPYFCKIFKAATGSTFIEYLNFIKIRNVENQFIFSNKNISEIAFSCGFKSIQHFNRVFKKQTGLSPKEYRAMIRHI